MRNIWTPGEREFNESAKCMHGINLFHHCKECEARTLRLAANVKPLETDVTRLIAQQETWRD
jgi:hypothetical protein